MQYSAVGGDGAIGGLEWTEEEQPQQLPFSQQNDPAQLNGAPATSSTAPADELTPSPEIVVPTLGQVDQLTEAQEAIIRQAQHQQATAIHGYGEPTPIEAVVDTDTEWNDRTFVRTRSTVDQSMLPPPPRHTTSASSSAGVIGGTSSSAAAAAPAPLLSQKLSPVHSRSSSSDAASIPGHRGPSTISAFGALAPAGAGAHSAAMVPGHAGSSHHRGSNPNSRRGSLSSDSLHAGEGLAAHSRRKSSAGPSTPVLGAAPSPAAAIPVSPSTIAAASTPGPAASPAPAVAVAAVASSPQPAQQPTAAGAGSASGSESQQLSSSGGGAPAGSNAQPPAPVARATSLQLAPSSGIPRDLPGGSSGAATLVNPRPFPKGLVRPSVHGPAASMSWAIGRAAGEEVKRVVKKDGSGSQSSNASPGYTAYMNAINEATAAQAAGVAVGVAAVGAGVAVAAASSSSSATADPAPAPRRSVVAAANLGPPPAMLKPGPPLPPRTHARQRTRSSVGSDLRRSSVPSSSDPSQLDHMESEHGTTEEDLIPLSPSVHLLMSSYLLLYMSLASLMPAWMAIMLPMVLYAAIGRIWPALHQITHHRKPRVQKQQMGKQSSENGGSNNNTTATSTSFTAGSTGTNPALIAAAQSLPKPA